MVEYEEGKVYLRDTRTGQIYLYERNLESNRNFEACIPNPVEESETEQDSEEEKETGEDA
jgi:hypothetical protein